MNPKNLPTTLRQFISMGMGAMVGTGLDKVNLAVEGPQLLQVSSQTTLKYVC